MIRGEGDKRGRGASEAHLLFEISSILLIHQNQIDVVANRKLLINISHCRSEVIATQEQANGNGLPCGMEWRRSLCNPQRISEVPRTGAPSMISYLAICSFSV